MSRTPRFVGTPLSGAWGSPAAAPTGAQAPTDGFFDTAEDRARRDYLLGPATTGDMAAFVHRGGEATGGGGGGGGAAPETPWREIAADRDPAAAVRAADKDNESESVIALATTHTRGTLSTGAPRDFMFHLCAGTSVSSALAVADRPSRAALAADAKDAEDDEEAAVAAAVAAVELAEAQDAVVADVDAELRAQMDEFFFAQSLGAPSTETTTTTTTMTTMTTTTTTTTKTEAEPAVATKPEAATEAEPAAAATEAEPAAAAKPEAATEAEPAAAATEASSYTWKFSMKFEEV